MARPSIFDREAAIEAAMQEMWRNGYEASSVKAVSEKLGITRSSYYNAFGTREDLFKEALAVYFAQSPDAVLHGGLPDMPIPVLLTRTFRAICKARAEDPEARGCLAINSLSELDTLHDELGVMIANAVLHSAARLEDLLKLAVSAGELAEQTDVHAMALALQNLLIGLNLFSKALRDEQELWLTASTTLKALGLYREDEHA
ncbi:TetR/AcrR family transcriptional regulator [Roseovarius sp.]|uniref:TetR/AcrR family transcriptional regulator n=1 Tax=Roseovarius sp. TaxID=1486281 RepID=UPI0026385E79|nr:TetR/AcrR family transcriptional regulator [Roseovarius sp.]